MCLAACARSEELIYGRFPPPLLRLESVPNNTKIKIRGWWLHVPPRRLSGLCDSVPDMPCNSPEIHYKSLEKNNPNLPPKRKWPLKKHFPVNSVPSPPRPVGRIRNGRIFRHPRSGQMSGTRTLSLGNQFFFVFYKLLHSKNCIVFVPSLLSSSYLINTTIDAVQL